MSIENPGSQQFLNSHFECRVQQVSPIIPWGFHFFLLTSRVQDSSLLPSLTSKWNFFSLYVKEDCALIPDQEEEADRLIFTGAVLRTRGRAFGHDTFYIRGSQPFCCQDPPVKNIIYRGPPTHPFSLR